MKVTDEILREMGPKSSSSSTKPDRSRPKFSGQVTWANGVEVPTNFQAHKKSGCQVIWPEVISFGGLLQAPGRTLAQFLYAMPKGSLSPVPSRKHKPHFQIVLP
jgi:hypothetical protein